MADEVLDVELKLDGVERRFREFYQFGELLGRHCGFRSGINRVLNLEVIALFHGIMHGTQKEMENGNLILIG